MCLDNLENKFSDKTLKYDELLKLSFKDLQKLSFNCTGALLFGNTKSKLATRILKEMNRD